MAITLTSTAFNEGGQIPSDYTCDEADISPPLAWSDVPDATQSFALIADDPDASRGTWVHWVLYDLPATVTELPPNVPPERNLSSGAKQGRNDFGKIGYVGPCPPSGTHRYFFKLYALDTQLGLDAGATKQQLLDAMDRHILAEGQLMGTYNR